MPLFLGIVGRGLAAVAGLDWVRTCGEQDLCEF
jgi:hypothetical protein